MKTRSIVFTFLLMVAGYNFSKAQEVTQDHFHDAEGNTYHQLFVDFKIAEIVEMKYNSDNVAVDGELSADGYSVIIKNYPGDKSITLIVKDATGATKEFTKSRCFIDPVLLEL